MEPTDDPANYRYGIFYFNQLDDRIVVPRALGWTFNYAHRWSYVITVVFVVAILATVILAFAKII